MHSFKKGEKESTEFQVTGHEREAAMASFLQIEDFGGRGTGPANLYLSQEKDNLLAGEWFYNRKSKKEDNQSESFQKESGAALSGGKERVSMLRYGKKQETTPPTLTINAPQIR